MARENYDYDEFATMSGGKLFTNSVRGFNKEEVIAYLDELSDKHQTERRTDIEHIKQLSRHIDELEAMLNSGNASYAQADNSELYVQLNEQQQYSQQLLADLEMQQQHIGQLMQDTEIQQQHIGQLTQDTEMQQQHIGQLMQDIEIQQQHIGQLTQDIEFLSTNAENAHNQDAAILQYEADINALHEQLTLMQNDNVIWQEEYQKSEQHIFGLQARIDQMATETGSNNEVYQQLVAEQNSSAEIYSQLELAEQEIQHLQQENSEFQQQFSSSEQDTTALRQQLEEAWNNAEYYKTLSKDEAHKNAEIAASSILADATSEAARIRDGAVAEKERLHRQIKNAANGISESVFNLRNEVAGIEGSVSNTFENMQHTLVNVLSALAQTEQDLSTFTVQVERFPISSPSVSRQQTASAFSPPKETPAPISPGHNPFVETGDSPVRKRSNVRAFRPTFSNSPAGGGYWNQSSEALQPDVQDNSEERMKDLSDSLVDTLRQMMN